MLKTNQSHTSDPDIRFSQDLTELEDLRKENKRVREQVDHWKGQLQKTTPETRMVRQKDVDRLAKNLVKSYESTLDTEQVSAELKKLGEFIVRKFSWKMKRPAGIGRSFICCNACESYGTLC